MYYSVVDQLEETLDRNGGQPDHTHFLGLLRITAEAEQGSLMLLATMRSDFLCGFQCNAALAGMAFDGLSLGPTPVDSTRLASVTRSEIRIWAISADLPLAALRPLTPICPSFDLRQPYLGEWHSETTANFDTRRSHRNFAE